MLNSMATEQEKNREFIAKSFFGTTNNPKDDVNPFEDMPNFLDATVGTLRWGISAVARRNSKMAFAFTYHRVLQVYQTDLAMSNILDAISDDDAVISDVVDKWTLTAVFN